MKPLWAWGGRYYGVRDGDHLHDRKGQYVGQFYGDEAYDLNGRYLGEIRSGDWLITDRSKKSRSRGIASLQMNRMGTSYADRVGQAMLAGYEDFPA